MPPSDESLAAAAALQTDELRRKLNFLLQDTNGDLVYSNEKALFGYLPASLHLVIPLEVSDAASTKVTIEGRAIDYPDLTAKEIGSTDGIKKLLGGTESGVAYRRRTTYRYITDQNLIDKVTYMNFVKLKNGGLDNTNAYVAAALRARWIALGAYSVLANEPTNIRMLSEVQIVQPNDSENATIYEKIAAADNLTMAFAYDVGIARDFIAAAVSEATGAAWVTKYAETVWCASEHCVRVRGHHYKNDYVSLLEKYMTSCHEGNFTWDKNLAHEHVFRTAIHPFGLYALPVLAAHFAIHGKLGNAGLLRFSGAPNGMAVVTTTAACLRAMAGEPWYKQYKTLYKDSMDLVNKAEEIIMANKYAWHLSANLYGIEKQTSCMIDGVSYTDNQLKEIGATLAAGAQGFIQAMKAIKESGQIATFSFENAKVLEKYAGNNPLSTVRIRQLVIYAINAVMEAKSVKSATLAALPAESEISDVVTVT